MIDSKPNIFDFATKELTLDAMIGWFLKCLHCEDDYYREIGLDYIRMIFNDDTLRKEDVKLHPESPIMQFYHMDVYAEISIRDKLYPLIFEDKTDTYLHGDQLCSYCEQVTIWMQKKRKIKTLAKKMGVDQLQWGGIKYIYTKSGYPFTWQKIDLKKEQKAAQKKSQYIQIDGFPCNLSFRDIYLEELAAFVERHCKRDTMLMDYYKMLSGKQSKVQNTVTNYFSAEKTQFARFMGSEEGDNAAGCCKLFEACFGEGVYLKHTHQHNASRDIFTTHNDLENNAIYYGFRIEKQSIGWVFRFYQYRDEAKTTGDQKLTAQRVEEVEKATQVCKEVCDRLSAKEYGVRFKDIQLDEKIAKDQEIFVIPISGCNSPKAACEFVHRFTECIQGQISQICEDATMCNFFATPYDWKKQNKK